MVSRDIRAQATAQGREVGDIEQTFQRLITTPLLKGNGWRGISACPHLQNVSTTQVELGGLATIRVETERA